MKIKYQSIKLRPETLITIKKANEIIEEYQAKGFDLTIRQLFYQFVARDLIKNSEREYKKLGSIIADGRLAGLIDWEAITDRTRYLRKQASWDSPEDIVEACAGQFRLDKWARQHNYVETYIEKDALIGVIEGVCNEHDVPYLACRGYASASEIWRAGHNRLLKKIKAGKSCTVLYLGDHDSSGIDMTRDIQDRLDLFTGRPGEVEVRRLALNMDQVEEYEPPPNPSKSTDPRAASYNDKYGTECWELDALSPEVISELIRAAIRSLRDDDLWQEAVEEEDTAKEQLGKIASQWDDVVSRLE